MRFMCARAILSTAAILVLAATAAAVPALAQEGEMPELTPEQQAEMEAYMKAGTPGPQHAMLAKEVGAYDVTMKNYENPDGPPMEMTGTATRSMLYDGRIMVEDYESEFMGMPFTGRGMTGYDNVSGKYWSTWMDSMSTGLMFSEGTCDDQGSCTFTGSYNDPILEGPKKVRMVTRWTSPTTQVFEMHTAGKDGKEMMMMEMTYTKK